MHQRIIPPKSALSQWKKYNSTTPFRVIHQPILGKVHALKKGMETARYEFLLICDDDNWLHRDYVKIAYEVMEQHPEVAIVGGRGQAVFEVDAPAWFTEYQELFRSWSPGRQFRICISNKKLGIWRWICDSQIMLGDIEWQRVFTTHQPVRSAAD